MGGSSCSDATGKEISDSSTRRNRKTQHQFLTDTIALDIITTNQLRLGSKTINGIYALNQGTQSVTTIASPSVLATGGASKVYLYTSNPDTASGDGIAMAWRAGCRVANMEFRQFHPTCLYLSASEVLSHFRSLKGEGAIYDSPTARPLSIW